MAVRYERPRSHASTWARRLGIFAVLLFAIVAISHRAGRMETPHFIAVALLSCGFAAAAFLLALAGLGDLWTRGASGGRAAFWGLILSLIILGPAAFVVQRYLELPALAEISTDTVSPPPLLRRPAIEENWLASLPGTGPLNAQAQRQAYPELTGRRYEGAIDRVLTAVMTVAEERGMAIVASEGTEGLRLTPVVEPQREPADEATEPIASEAANEGPADGFVAPLPTPAPRGMPAPPVLPERVLIQGVVVEPLFGLASDIVIRLTDEEETTFVDMRAMSRYGNHDLGLSAWQVESFLEALDAALMGGGGA